MSLSNISSIKKTLFAPIVGAVTVISLVLVLISSSPTQAQSGGASVMNFMCPNGNHLQLSHSGILPAHVCYDAIEGILYVKNIAPYKIIVSGPYLEPLTQVWSPGHPNAWQYGNLYFHPSSSIPSGGTYQFRVTDRNQLGRVYMIPDTDSFWISLGLETMLSISPFWSTYYALDDDIAGAISNSTGGIAGLVAGLTTETETVNMLVDAGLEFSQASAKASAAAQIAVNAGVTGSEVVNYADALRVYSSESLHILREQDVFSPEQILVHRVRQYCPTTDPNGFLCGTYLSNTNSPTLHQTVLSTCVVPLSSAALNFCEPIRRAAQAVVSGVSSNAPNSNSVYIPQPPTTSVTKQQRNAPDGYFTGNLIRFTSTVSRPESSNLSAKVLTLVVRGPNNENLSRVCAVNIVISGNGGTYKCNIPRVFTLDGNYRYWWSYKDQNNQWHNLSDEYVFNLTHRDGRQGVSDVQLNARDGFYVGNQINFSSLVTRAESQWNGNALPMKISIRDPENNNVSLNCANQVTIAPESTFDCDASGVFTKAGTYTYWYSWRGASGNNPWYRMSGDRTFELEYRDGRMGASGIKTTPPDGWHTGNEIRFRATITRGESPWNGNALPMNVSIRDPEGNNVALTCANQVTIAPLESYECYAEDVFTKAGTYTYWYSWKAASSGNWHRLSENRTFTLTHRPGRQGVSDVAVSAPNGWKINEPINFSALVTRAESSWNGNALPMKISIRDPQGNNVALTCADQVTIAPESTFDCNASGTFTTPGTYKYWFSWRGASGDNPWYRMSGDRTFELN